MTTQNVIAIVDDAERLREENKKLRTMMWLMVDDAMTLGMLLPMTVKRAREMVDYK